MVMSKTSELNFFYQSLIIDVFYFLFTNYFSKWKYTPVLEVELDVDEMAKSHKAWTFFPRNTNYYTLRMP